MVGQPLNSRSSWTGRLACLAAGLVCLALAGCFMQQLRGQRYSDDLGSLGRGMRPKADKHEFWGWDERARQTEEDLGK